MVTTKKWIHVTTAFGEFQHEVFQLHDNRLRSWKGNFIYFVRSWNYFDNCFFSFPFHSSLVFRVDLDVLMVTENWTEQCIGIVLSTVGR